MVIPALSAAADDTRLRWAPLAVYVWLLCHHLDLQTYRPVKLSGIAIACRLKRHTASRALRVLVERGYIERRGQAATGYEYRLVHQLSNAHVA